MQLTTTQFAGTVVAFVGRPRWTALRIAASHFRLREASSWDGVRDLLMRVPADVAIVDPAAVGRPSADPVLALLSEFRYTPIVVYAALTPELAGIVAWLTRVGLRDVIVQGYDDTPHRIQALAAERRDLDVVTPFLEKIDPLLTPLPPLLRDALVQVVWRPRLQWTDAMIAERAAISTRSLYRWLGRVEVPSVRRYVTGVRILRAYGFLREHGQAVGAVADKVGYREVARMGWHMRAALHCLPNTIRHDESLTPTLVVERIWSWIIAANP